MDPDFSKTLEALDDIALALLTCLVAQEHLIIYAPPDSLAEVDARIARTASSVFSFDCARIECTPDTTVSELSEAIIAPAKAEPAKHGLDLDTRQLAHVVVARDLDRASYEVQIQLLEVMRQRRAQSRKAIHQAPRDFVLVALLPAGKQDSSRYLNKHINDHFFLSHTHETDFDDDDEEESDAISPASSENSVIRHSSSSPHVSPANIAALHKQLPSIRTTAEIRRHAHNVTTHLRLHPAVAGGISARANAALGALMRTLALLHGLAYVTPAAVHLAARKVFPHRVVLAGARAGAPQTARLAVFAARSLQWGSDAGAVAAALAGTTAGEVVDEVLATVQCPL